MTLAEEISVASLADLSTELLGGNVWYLPIRHHSPACARFVQAVVQESDPWAVLVEGPPSYDELIPLLVHPEATMPLAIHSFTVFGAGSPDIADDPAAEHRIGTYFPLCDYSPELVALRAGAAAGARLGFVDLEHPDLALRGSLEDHHGLVDERVYAYSATLKRLGADLGCRDHNELWDRLIEAADLDRHALLAAVAAYGCLARIDPDPVRAAVDDAREAAMAELVRREIDVRDAAGSTRPIIVVTGAYHAVALPALVAAAPPAGDRRDEGGRDRAEVRESGHGLIRYSFDRLDALSGYGAGMPAPAWYQQLWHEPDGSAGRLAAAETLAAVAALLRERNGDGYPATPSLVDAHAHVELLAQLRNHPDVARSDVVDAVTSCFVKGEAAADVAEVVHRVMTGSRVGRLPPGTPRSPIAVDFDARARAVGLALDTSEPRRIELNLYRSLRHREISRFLHGCLALGIAYGLAQQQPRYARTAGRDVIREIWVCRFSAETDMTLTEASRWGASIDEAVETQLRSQLHDLLDTQPGSDQLMRLVLAAAQRGVHAAIDPILGALCGRIGVDPELSSVRRALTEAHLIWTAREPLDGRALGSLPAIGEQLYVRATSLVDDLAAAAPDEVPARVEDLRDLTETVSAASWLAVDPSLLWDALARVRAEVAHAELRGAIDGLRWHHGQLADEPFERQVLGHLDPAADEEVGPRYLTGLLAVARESLWHRPSLLEGLSAFLGGLDADQFVRRLPGLRSAFAELAPRETDQIAEQLVALHGIRTSVRVTDQSEVDLLAAVAVGAHAEARLVADGFADWLRPGAGARREGEDLDG